MSAATRAAWDADMARLDAATRAAWDADMARLDAALAEHVIEIDGQFYLAETAPQYAAELHGKLTQIGYANGFIQTEEASA